MLPLICKIQREVFSAPDVTDVPRIIDIQIEGWMPDEFTAGFERALEQTLVGRGAVFVIEVGSWKGLSANRIAKICKTHGLHAEIMCVDTWLGSPEHMEGESASQGMDRVNGIPNLLSTFAKNTKASGNDDVIFPFPISSAQGATYLSNHGVLADVIYIDAGHEYESVLLDITLFWRLLKPGGVMIMDDYQWPGVRQAIDEFFSDCHVEVGNLQALIIKPISFDQ